MNRSQRGSADVDELVARAQAHDESAFEQLVQRFRRELQVHCYRICGAPETRRSG